MIFSLIVTVAYLGYVIKLFGVPWSISDTYYKLENKRKGLGILFTLWTWIGALTLMIAWLNYNLYQPLVFLACMALMFVGTAAQFKQKLTEMVHYVSAGVCVASALAWLLLAGFWYVPLITFMICIPIAIADGKWIFWIEIAALIATYITLFLIEVKALITPI